MEKANSISLLCDITRIVNSTNPIDKVFSDVANRCAYVLKLDKVAIYSYDMNNEVLVQRAVSSNDKNVQDNNASELPSKHFDNIFSSQRSIINSTSQLSIPITWKGKIYGMIDSFHRIQKMQNDTNEMLFVIIASLLTPKLLEIHKSKREFEDNNKYYHHLIELLEKEKLYKDENLSLKRVADLLEVSVSYMSQIINIVSKKSFSTLINEYRTQEVLEAFQEGKHIRYSLLSIAFDAGFSSKSTFNSVFKNVLGCSPSQYIRKYV